MEVVEVRENDGVASGLNPDLPMLQSRAFEMARASPNCSRVPSTGHNPDQSICEHSGGVRVGVAQAAPKIR